MTRTPTRRGSWCASEWPRFRASPGAFADCSRETGRRGFVSCLRRHLKVLHVVSRLQYGGIERYLLTLVRGLDHTDFRCDVACVGRLASERDPLVAAFRHAGARVLYLPVLSVGQLATFRARVLEGRYDVVQSHLGDVSGLLAAVLARSRVRFVASYHNANLYPEDSFAKRLILRTGREWLRLARVPVSGCSEYAIVSHFVPRGFWQPAHYGVDIDRFHPGTAPECTALRRAMGIPDDRIVITHIGRFVAQKNHALLLDTAQLVQTRLPAVLFVLIGAGPLRGWVEEEIRVRSLDRTVSLAGVSGAPEATLRASDVFFFPSRFEGFGLALLEAYAAGLPVVATDLPAFREFTSRLPAIRLVAPRADALADSLLEVIGDLDAQRAAVRMALGGIRDRFSTAAAVQRWKDLMSGVWGAPTALGSSC